MAQFEKFDELLKIHNGIIWTTQVVEAGISKPTFYLYVKEKALEQAARCYKKTIKQAADPTIHLESYAKTAAYQFRFLT